MLDDDNDGLFYGQQLPVVLPPSRNPVEPDMNFKKIANRMGRSMKETRLMVHGMDPFGYLMTRYANLEPGVQKDMMAVVLLKDIVPRFPKQARRLMGADELNDVGGNDTVIRIGGAD